jgi:flagellar basal-body rod modification protein FlgD
MAITTATTGLRTVASAEAEKASQKAATRPGQLDRDSFLQLLTTQLRYQNPLEPASSTEFLGELANFSTVESLQQLNSGVKDLLLLQQISQGSGLIGHTVTYQGGNGGATTGVVQGIAVQDGQVQLQLERGSVPLSQLQGVK